MAGALARQLTMLETAKLQYGAGCEARVADLLRSLRSAKFHSAQELILFHDVLLFLRAFPQGPAVVHETELLLGNVRGQVDKLSADLTPFEPENVSGIAGTTISDTFTYEVARWLSANHPAELSIEWDEDEQQERLGMSLARFLPLLEEDSLVEADVPYLEWLHAADTGARHDLNWLMCHLDVLPLTIAEKTEIYDSLDIVLRWNFADAHSRTLFRWPSSEFFFHKEPLLRRKDVSLSREFASADIPIRKLTAAEGEKVLDMVRGAVTVRYRELYGTTRGDPTQVVEARPGRGVSIFFWGLPPARRLPLRAYHAGLTVKNGIPIGYIEDIGLFEWVEIGFNTFYAYRDGESAWLYSKILHLLHQMYGYTCFSVYPYQIGQHNEEAIRSGAFWFYRKLGFRPGPPELLKLTEKEERKMATDHNYRTSARSLRKLARGHLFYDMAGTSRGVWDSFSMRNIGLAVQRQMAKHYRADVRQMRQTVTKDLACYLQCDLSGWQSFERSAFENLAFVLSLVPTVAHWTRADKEALVCVIRAKAGADETGYLHNLRAHACLKQALLKIGTAQQ
jgi:hypothetical protein